MKFWKTLIAIPRTVVWFLYFFGALLYLIIPMRKAKRLIAAGDTAGVRALVNRYVPMWANTLLHIAGVTVTVRGREHLPEGRAVVFTPNHQSDYDIPLMLTQFATPPALVAKIQTKKIPLVRTWMEFLDCIFLDRDNPRQAVAAMNEVGGVLERGVSVVVFPEGTRSKGGPMKEFKSGAFKMACKARALVVPVVIDGSFRAMEANHNLMCPAHITMTILPPIDTALLDRAAQKELPGVVAAQIAAQLPKEQQPNPV